MMPKQQKGDGGEAEKLLDRLDLLSRRSEVIAKGEFIRLLRKTMEVFSLEPADMRPKADTGYPGGLIHLKRDIPTVIIPDIHGRTAFIPTVLRQTDEEGISVADRLVTGDIQILCLGDAFHGEARAARRWYEAYREFMAGYRIHAAMDMEMRENFSVMEMILYLKSSFPEHFHFLKGNHENIRNESERGNYAFGKFVNEGAMVRSYVASFVGEDFLSEYGEFEHSLPLLAVGNGFLASHAEPEDFYPEESVINYREHPDVVYGLTWTGNDEAKPGSVAKMISHYLKPSSQGRYFGGHRPVDGLFALRAEGRYIQINNPSRFVIGWIPVSGDIEPEKTVQAIR